MKKRVAFKFIALLCFSFILSLFLISAIYAESVENTESTKTIDSEILKLTNYAEEYESGNINYVQLAVYLGNTRERMNEIMGVVENQYGGILKEEQLRNILGKETEKTRWAWNEKKQREERQKSDIPVWRKIIFDGNKIRIWINAWPSLLGRNKIEEIVYRLDVRLEFKKSKEKFELDDEILEIKELAEDYQKNPTNENANNLAKKSVLTENKFQELMKNNQDKCESYMRDIFGTENKISKQKTIVKEIEFYSGDDFNVNMRLEMCDECEWHWVNLDFWIDSRGMFEQPKEPKFEKLDINAEKMSGEYFKEEIKSTFEEIENALAGGDYNSAYKLKSKLRILGDAWSEKSNNIWKEVDKIFEDKRKSMTESPDKEDPYYWIKQEQEKRKMVDEIMDKNYLERKQFYLDLVSKYESKNYIFNQIQYEKRLVEIFGEFGEEICTNNKDDNKDNNVDCADEACNGKICGSGEVEITVDNQTTKQTKNLYCIMKECKAKEEILTENASICGNHICEGNELETCKEDCTQCKQYEAINCSGKVMFKGTDENNCPLEPICLEEDLTCSITEDCSQPLCGKAECIEGTCQTSSLDECREAECTEGQKKVLKCENGDEVISGKCFDGLWKDTGIACEVASSGENPKEEIKEDDFAGNECIVKEDCGNVDDVCSNGICTTIPKQEESEEETEEIVLEEPAEENPVSEGILISDIEESVSSDEETQGITGNVIKSIVNTGKKITGYVITGFEVEGSESNENEAENNADDSSSGAESGGEGQSEESSEADENKEQENSEENNQQENQDDEEDERKQDDKRRRNEECNKNCEDNCERNVIVPCVQKCVFDSKCGVNCDSNIESCKKDCKKEKDTNPCQEKCKEACKKGEGFNMQQENMNKFEEAVFKLNGQCRISDEKTEGGIYFDGWGKPFEDLRYLKQEYYSSGSNDWCKDELEDYLKQRKEFEKSMNSEFLVWFFEQYMANTAEDWEEHVSGIYDIYWRDVEFSKQIARTMQCSDLNASLEFNLINIKYESDYGKIEFWEELKSIKTSEFGEKISKQEKEITVLTPYMKIWIFPPKEFILYEMKKAMKEHEFPGKGEDKTKRENGNGPTEEEKEKIQQNKAFMNTLKKISEKYGGSVEGVVQFKNYATNEIAFNLYFNINEEDIIKMQPMLPEEVTEQDIKIEIDFDKIYDMIYTTQKEMEGERIESPPWAREESVGIKLNEVKNAMGVYFKIKNILDSATITPEGSEKDVRKLLNKFFLMMMQQDNKEQQDEEISEKLEDASSKEFQEIAKEE